MCIRDSTNELHDPQFGETTVEQESTATIPAPEGLPEGAKVTRGEGAPEWVTVNEDGSIEAKPTLERPKTRNIPFQLSSLTTMGPPTKQRPR